MILNPLTAEAGPVLDSAIAVEVMGWKHRDYGNEVVGHFWLLDCGEGRTRSLGSAEFERDGWEPSTDPRHALIVAEKSGVSGMAITRHVYEADGPFLWCAYDAFDTDAPPKPLAPTFPLLICRAALYLERGGEL